MIKAVIYTASEAVILIVAPISYLLPAIFTYCMILLMWLALLPIFIFICKTEPVSSTLVIFTFTMLQAGFLVYKQVAGYHANGWKSRLKNASGKKELFSANLEKLSKDQDEIKKKEYAIVNLYEITKKMSECLKFEDIFNAFSEILKDGFSFDRCDLLVVDWEAQEARIAKTYTACCQAPEGGARAQAAFHDKLLKILLKDPKEMFIETEDGKKFAIAPLFSEKKIMGVLVIENLSREEMERFVILAAQFALEAKKVLLYEMVEKLAITDSLTGLYVRRYFSERVGEELQRSRRHKLKFAFLMIDIDDFKKCNDTHGHLVGDAILKDLARIMKEGVREIDLVARYGGEEFAIVLPETGIDNARCVAERLRKRISDNVFRAYDEKLNITVSIGIAIYPADAENLSGLVERSDEALYNAKKSGKNLVREYKKGYNKRL